MGPCSDRPCRYIELTISYHSGGRTDPSFLARSVGLSQSPYYVQGVWYPFGRRGHLLVGFWRTYWASNAEHEDSPTRADGREAWKAVVTLKA